MCNSKAAPVKLTGYFMTLALVTIIADHWKTIFFANNLARFGFEFIRDLNIWRILKEMR